MMRSGSAFQVNGLGFALVLVTPVDGGLQVDDGAQHAALEATSAELGEEALDGGKPRAGSWREASRQRRPTNSQGLSVDVTTSALRHIRGAAELGRECSDPRTRILSRLDDLDRLIILHDVNRWQGQPVVKEVNGFKIVKAG